MSRRDRESGGFSLVEVTLALGVAAFCLLTLFGLLPLGFQTNQNSISQTTAASLLSSIVADLRATPKTRPTSVQYVITFGIAKVLYLDAEGRAVSPMNPTATPRYRASISFPPSPGGSGPPTFVCLRVSWPALADPATNTPAGSVETFAVIDRP